MSHTGVKYHPGYWTSDRPLSLIGWARYGEQKGRGKIDNEDARMTKHEEKRMMGMLIFRGLLEP